MTVDWPEIPVPRFRHVSNWNCLGESAPRRPRPHVQRHLSGGLTVPAPADTRHSPPSASCARLTPRRTARARPRAPACLRRSPRCPAAAVPAAARRTYQPWPPPREPPAAATPRRKAGRHRGEGQWAVGHFTPLNGNEQFKKDDDGLNVRTRIETIYSKRGFDSIDPDDLRGRMRWWGLYTQRKPGIDGGKTAILEPEELDDEYFMLRVRIDGGRLTTAQLRVDRRDLAGVRPRHRRHHRPAEHPAPLDPHRGRARDLASGWRPSGCPPPRPAATRPRVILGSPVAGIAADEIIDGTPAIDEIHDRYIGSKEFSNLPRKFKTAISGSPAAGRGRTRSTTSPSSASTTPSTAPASTSGSAAACPPTPSSASGWAPGCRWTRSPDVWAGVVGIFRDYGYRRLRTRARLKFLVADWGPEKFRQVLEDEYLERKLVDGPAPEQPVAAAGATTSACTGSRTAASTSASRRASAGSTAPRSPRSPSWPPSTARAGCAPPSSRR